MDREFQKIMRYLQLERVYLMGNITNHCNDSFAPLTVSGIMPMFAEKCSVGAVATVSMNLENDGMAPI